MQTNDLQQYLTFLLGQELYAAHIMKIKEIIEYSPLTDVPMMPHFIRGVINLRGRAVPVVDLLARFGKGVTPAGTRTCIVILETERDGARLEMGIIVDAVNEVMDLHDRDVEAPPSFGARPGASFILGMGKVAEKFVIILDTDRLLSIEETVALTGLAEAPLPVEEGVS